MIKGLGGEFVRAMTPKFQERFIADPLIPLEIKLHMERLRLAELMRKAREDGDKFSFQRRQEFRKAS